MVIGYYLIQFAPLHDLEFAKSLINHSTGFAFFNVQVTKLANSAAMCIQKLRYLNVKVCFCCVVRWEAFGYQSAGFNTCNRPGTSAVEIEQKL